MIKNVIVSIITIILTIIGTAYYNSISTLEYKDSFKEQYLNISTEVLKDFTLTYKEKEIKSISMYQVAIFNRTWNDFENVNLYFTFKMKNNKKIPTIINKRFFAPSNLPSNIGISEIKKINNNTYKVNIKVLKQTITDKYYLGRFIFEGNEIPDISLSMPENVGLEVNTYTHTKEWAILISVFVGFIIIFIIIISIIADFDVNRNWKKRIEKIKSVLDANQQIDNKVSNEIIVQYENKYKPKDGIFYKKILDIVKYFKNKKE